MKLLIINADDYGYCAGINQGIITAYQKGVITSTTIMPGMPGFEQATALAKANPELGVGIHLTLTCNRPILNDVPSLVDEQGYFHKITYYEQDFTINPEELYREWQAQIEKVIAAGIQPDHLDSHHHVHVLQQISPVFEKLAKAYNLPVRGNYQKSADIKSTRRFYSTFDNLSRSKAIWKPFDLHSLVEDVQTYGSVEIMCHPGYLDADIIEGSSLTVNRTYTLRELQDPRYPALFQNAQIQLGNFSQL